MQLTVGRLFRHDDAMSSRLALLATLVVLLIAVSGCAAPGGGSDRAPGAEVEPSAGGGPGADVDSRAGGGPTAGSALGAELEPGALGARTVPPPTRVAPEWLGTRPLARSADGAVLPTETPEDLLNRQFTRPGPLPSRVPDRFVATLEPVPPAVLARSTYRSECPVTPDELVYLTLTFWGFDGWSHMGEMIVHRDVAADVLEIFEALYDARFPIEEMRVIAQEELDAEPTGDGNVTTAFVCRRAFGLARWSEHAYGRAVDINPFHNPYVRGETVIPELARVYADRSRVLPGMIVPGDAVATAFAEAGWTWGGTWVTPLDWMHFSTTGR